MWRTRLHGALAAALLLSASGLLQAQGRGSPQDFDIPAGSLIQALDRFGEQSGLQVTYDATLLQGKRAPAVSGQLSADAVLTRLLQGSGLASDYVNDRSIVIKRAAEPVVEPKAETRRAPTSSPDAETDPANLEKIVVTGTHIRGPRDSASPVNTYTRDEIIASGVGTVRDFLRRMPENFGGGAAEETLISISGGGTALNFVGGTGVNLRGLGSDSTLTLVNGRRIAPGNTAGNFVDVTMLPLTAVERVEVVPDGASAIYGADAVGGVVNFIMSKDYEGAEVRLRSGVGAGGTPQENQVGLLGGSRWQSGSAVLSYEYYDRTALRSRDRDYSEGFVEPFTLLPTQKRQSVYFNLDQDVHDKARLFATSVYANRKSTYSLANINNYQFTSPAEIDSISVNGGIEIDVAPSLTLLLSSTYSTSDTHRRGWQSGALTVDAEADTRILSFDALLSGDLFENWAGTVRFALGGQSRDEDFSTFNARTNASRGEDRRVQAGFAELQVPLKGPRAGERSNRLELTLASRLERYSDFGNTTNPKVGLVWHPMPGMRVRSTYGTSFKAPVLNDISNLPSVVFDSAFDPQANEDRNYLILYGPDDNLGPEEATTWSVGFDLEPAGMRGFGIRATYFDVDFEGRITNAQSAGFNVNDAFRIESVLGPTILRRNPSMAEVQRFHDEAYQVANLSGQPLDLATVVALVDSRTRNMSSLETRGFDFGISYRADLPVGQLSLSLDGTRIISYRTKVTEDTPGIEFVDTPFNPVGLKLRAQGIYSHGGWTLGMFLNHTDSYIDNTGEVSRPVSSWKTIDMSLAHHFQNTRGLLADASVQLSATNVTNENPPFLVGTPPYFIPYDGANASPLGRFVSLSLSKRW